MIAKVTTIVVTYNGSRWISKCLNSLINSSILTSIIVVDNCSHDDTVEIVKRYDDVDLISSKTNLGFGKANNIGLKIAIDNNTDYVFLINQDAWVEQDTIEKLIQAHKGNQEYGIISPIHLNGSGDIETKFLLYLSPLFTPEIISDAITERIQENIYPTIYVNAAAWLLPVSTLKDIGGFLPEFNHYGEDDNYLHRCRYHHKKIGILPTSFITHDRNQNPVPIKTLKYKKIKNYIFSHLLVDITNPNISIVYKAKNIIINILKGIIHNPFATINSVFNIIFNLIPILKSLKRSKNKFPNFLSQSH